MRTIEWMSSTIPHRTLPYFSPTRKFVPFFGKKTKTHHPV